MRPTLWLALVLAAGLIGCADEIGDECETALDCSQQGSRACDRTQPGGYCTIRGCERHTCPEEAVCVKFRPEQERLAVTYCMLECEDDDDCRSDEGYHCTSMDELGSGQEAIVLDGARKRFCSAVPKEPLSPVDSAGSSGGGAGTSSAADEDASIMMSIDDGG